MESSSWNMGCIVRWHQGLHQLAQRVFVLCRRSRVMMSLLKGFSSGRLVSFALPTAVCSLCKRPLSTQSARDLLVQKVQMQHAAAVAHAEQIVTYSDSYSCLRNPLTTMIIDKCHAVENGLSLQQLQSVNHSLFRTLKYVSTINSHDSQVLKRLAHSKKKQAIEPHDNELGFGDTRISRITNSQVSSRTGHTD